ncbi:hypothetical protein [Actinocrispum wychmicini]|uniref:Uncharacterized protein n=1 Tax=Actinocrispum wychmicini TaxID=1213861 RepID=A0A4R2IWD2_9PSEU|nr:hypothetical protein [Actinocrispum wychmicini]TCO49804.1 hypothetical protein EV192_114174 [Actinocrispum wychmicini]
MSDEPSKPEQPAVPDAADAPDHAPKPDVADQATAQLAAEGQPQAPAGEPNVTGQQGPVTAAGAAAPPPPPPYHAPPRPPGGFGRFVRHRATQIVAAGLAGLVIGGGAIALINHGGNGRPVPAHGFRGDGYPRGGPGFGPYGGPYDGPYRARPPRKAPPPPASATPQTPGTQTPPSGTPTPPSGTPTPR